MADKQASKGPDEEQMLHSEAKEGPWLTLDQLQDMVQQRDATIAGLQEQIKELTTSQSHLAARSAEWNDELDTLRTRMPLLEQELNQTKVEKDELQDRVKDLRVRAEESRRAIMRLQGERKTDNRRSMQPGTLQAWNPAVVPEDTDGSSSATAGPSSLMSPVTSSLTAEEKKNRRTSSIFGGVGTVKSRHTRTPSDGRSFTPEPDAEGSSSNNSINSGFNSGRRNSRSGLGLPERTQSLLSADNGNVQGSSTGQEVSTPSQSRRSSSLLVPPAQSGRPASMNFSPAFSSTSGQSLGSPLLDQNPLRLSSAVSDDGEAENSASFRMAHSSSPSSTFGAMQLMRQKETKVEQLRSEMQRLQAKLEEAVDARKASDECLKALRDFIGEGGPEDGEEARAALRGVKLPPLPTSTDELDDEADVTVDAQQKEAAGSSGNWASKWNTFVSRLPAPPTTSNNDDSRSTAGDEARNLASPVMISSEMLTSSPKSDRVSKGNGLASPPATSGLPSLGSFFQRTPSSSNTCQAGGSRLFSSSASAGNKALRPAFSHRESSYSDQSVDSVIVGSNRSTTDTSVAPSSEGAYMPPTAAAGAAFNRLSTWFKKPTGSGDSSSTKGLPEDGNDGSSTVDSAVVGLAISSDEPSPPSPPAVKVDSIENNNSSSNDDSIDSHLTPEIIEATKKKKDLQVDPRVAKTMSRAEAVSEDGAVLGEGAFVPPTFN